MKDFKSIYTNSKRYEKDIETEILTVLNRYGFFWKVDYAGKLVKGKWYKNPNPFVIAGMPDVQGIIAGLPPFFFEIKIQTEYNKIINNWDKYKAAPPGVSSNILRYKRQIETIEKLRSLGATAEFVYNLAQVKSIIEREIKKNDELQSKKDPK